MNGFLIRLCWKNVWRNKRRTLLTVNAIGFGVMVLVWLYNHYDAIHEQIIANAVSYDSGHLIVSAPEYEESKPVDRFMKDPHAISDWLSNNQEVKSFSPQIIVQGMLSSPRGSLNIWLKGVDANREKATTRFASSIVQGAFFGTNQVNPIVVGSLMAKNLKLAIGSKVVILTQGVDGSIGNELFFVVGIFKTNSDADKLFAFTDLSSARHLLSLPPTAIHRISVILHREQDLQEVYDSFTAAFGNQSVQALTWRDIQKHITALIELDKSSGRLIMWIILFVASLGIVNAILMGLLERSREFGVMLAIGTTKKEIMKMVVMETVLLSSVGILIGNIAGALLTLYFHLRGFDLKWFTSQPLRVGGMMMQTLSYPNLSLRNSLLITAAIFTVTLLISVVPMRHVSKLNVIGAINSK